MTTILKGASTKLRKNSVKEEIKYQILNDYIYSAMTNKTIGEKYSVHEKTVEKHIRNLYKDFLNVRETKALITSQPLPLNFTKEILDNNQINQSFLKHLSEPDSLTLSDNELLFCELFHQDGDEVKAIEVAGLAKGLRKSKENYTQYKVSASLRGFYLRRKPNVASYIQTLQKERLSVLADGKVFLQSELLSVIEKLRKADGERSTASYLKAVETLGRIMGAFQDKVEVTSLNGDSALDAMMAKMKSAKSDEELIEL